MEPWDIATTNFANDQVPTLVVAAQADTVAPVAQHARVFYASLSTARPKMYLEMAGASHFVSNSPNTTIAQFEIAWLKRFIDNDTRYTQFLCPPASAPNATSAVTNTCPF
jgi:predicted dienelactone hydrolase